MACRSGAHIKPRGIVVHVCESRGGYNSLSGWLFGLLPLRRHPGCPGMTALAQKRLCGSVFHVYTELSHALLTDLYQFMFLHKV